METPRIFYRIANNETEQGLWYDFKGNFTGLIHNKFNFCTNKDLPMPFDEKIRGWLSATSELEELWFWFSKEDIQRLEEYGFYITVYSAIKYRFHNNHWVICQRTSLIQKQIRLKELK